MTELLSLTCDSVPSYHLPNLYSSNVSLPDQKKAGGFEEGNGFQEGNEEPNPEDREGGIPKLPCTGIRWSSLHMVLSPADKKKVKALFNILAAIMPV